MEQSTIKRQDGLNRIPKKYSLKYRRQCSKRYSKTC